MFVVLASLDWGRLRARVPLGEYDIEQALTMRAVKNISDLLPEHDPPLGPRSGVFAWIFVILASVGLMLTGLASGPGFAIFLVLWLIAVAIVFRFPGLLRGMTARGTRADDASLREEIRQWKDISNGLRR